MVFRGTYNEELAVVIVENPTDELELALYRELSIACITAAVRVCSIKGEKRFLQLYVFQAAQTVYAPLAEAWTKILLHVTVMACNSIGAESDFCRETRERRAS
jgi:hypothetical protein